MKVKCVTTEGRGLIFKDSSSGLSVGKVYSVMLCQSSMTDVVDEANVRFYLYNDNGAWAAYKPYFFIPVE